MIHNFQILIIYWIIKKGKYKKSLGNTITCRFLTINSIHKGKMKQNIETYDLPALMMLYKNTKWFAHPSVILTSLTLSLEFYKEIQWHHYVWQSSKDLMKEKWSHTNKGKKQISCRNYHRSRLYRWSTNMSTQAKVPCLKETARGIGLR